MTHFIYIYIYIYRAVHWFIGGPVNSGDCVQTLLKPFKWQDTLQFKFCKSVHHCTVQINHQPDATVFQFIILTFICSSTCFGRSSAHHQELNDCSGSLWFYLRIVVIAVLCSWLGQAARPQTQHCHCSHWAPDDGWENAWSMLSCKWTSG
jgi:hypothetical protein